MISRINHTQLSNDFIDRYMSKLSGNAVKIFISVSRKTIGWHKETDRISFSQMIKLTGIVSRTTINKAILELEEAEIITVDRSGMTNTYEIRYGDQVVQKMDQTGTENGLLESISGTENGHTKEIKTKETYQKKYTPPKDNKFEEWYNLYDKKVSRFNAEKLWNKLSSADKDSCLAVVKQYVLSTPDKQYRKQPDTYLRNRCWEDEIIFKQQNKSNNSAIDYFKNQKVSEV